MEKIRVHDDETMSGSGSGLSDLSALENETDTLGRAIIQHAKDARRIKSVLHGKQAPFSKARPRQTVTRKLQRLEMNEHASTSHVRNRSSDLPGKESEPPLNVPREWGRKSRPERTWIRRTQVETQSKPYGLEERIKGEVSGADDDDGAIVSRHTAYTGDDYWSPGRKKLLPSPDSTPPSMRRKIPVASPTSLRHMNSTLKDITQLEDKEFLDASLYASTPAPTRHDPSANSRQSLHAATWLEQASADGYRSLKNKSGAASHDKENVPLNDTADTGVPTLHPDRFKRNILSGTSGQPGQRSRHSRNDSMQLLKQLARVSSLSPSPARHAPVYEDIPATPTNVTKSTAAQSDAKRQHGISAAVSTIEGVNEAQTPVVTGAWVSSPDSKNESKPLSEEAASVNLGSTEEAKSSRPRSVLEDIVRQAKLHPDGQIGDTTLQSLENIVHPSVAADDFPAVPQRDVAEEAVLDKDEQPPMTQAQKDRRQEDLAIEAMNKHLRAARTSIKDANKGLQRVENRLEHSPSKADHRGAHTFQAVKEPAQTDANGRTICEHCGGAYTSIWRGLWVEFRSNFYIWDPKAPLGIRLTWFGATLLTWLTWYLLESMLCFWYCQPLYAYRMVGYGVDPDAPRFPFVLPTLIFRPFRPIWQPAVQWLAWAFGVLFHWVFGEGAKQEVYPKPAYVAARPRPSVRLADEFSTHVRSIHRRSSWLETATAAAASASTRAARSAMDAIDEVGTMWDDSFIT